VELARSLAGELLILHVLPPIVIAETYVTPEIYTDLDRAARITAQKHLDRLVARARQAGVRASSRLADGPPVHERIAQIARATRATVIVMGTHGRSGITRLVLGSVAARVLMTAPCPVLTVRPRS
jgi:nucleotide-binding universal stress UspA family protein